MQALFALIEGIMQHNGFSCIREDGYIIAKKEDTRAALCLQVAFDIKSFKKFLKDFSDFDGKKILVAVEDISEEAYDIDSDVIIWDKKKLEEEVAKASINPDQKSGGIIDEIESTDFPPIVSLEDLEDVENASIGDFILRLNITEKEIEEEYPHHLSKSLKLIPYYVFNYSVKSSEEELNHSRKMIAVNSVNMHAEFWKDIELIYSMEVPHIKMQSSLKQEDAETIALDEIIEANGCVKEYIIEDKQTTLTEKKKMYPRKEEISLEYLNVYYVPVWYIMNEDDEICVNAYNKKISDVHKSAAIAH